MTMMMLMINDEDDFDDNENDHNNNDDDDDYNNIVWFKFSQAEYKPTLKVTTNTIVVST